MFELSKILMDTDEHMAGNMMGWFWWGFPFMGYYMLIIWALFILVAFLVYKDAEKRGMDGLLWFILIIIPWIGLIALLIYLIIREEKATRTPPTSQSATTTSPKQEVKIICPYCRAENPPTAKFCSKCGSSLEP